MSSNVPIDNETFIVQLYDPDGGATIGTIGSMKVTVSRDESMNIYIISNSLCIETFRLIRAD